MPQKNALLYKFEKERSCIDGRLRWGRCQSKSGIVGRRIYWDEFGVEMIMLKVDWNAEEKEK